MNIKKHKTNNSTDSVAKQSHPINIKRLLSIGNLVYLILFSIIAMLLMYKFKYNETINIKRVSITKDTYVKINAGKEKRGNIQELLNTNTIKKGDEVELRIKLPKNNNISNPVVTAYIPNSTIKFYYDKKEIYSKGENNKIGDIVGVDFLKIPIPSNFSNKELKIYIHVFDPNNIGRLYDMHILNTYDADTYNIRSQTVNIYISNFLYVFGVICILLNFKGFWKYHESKKLLYVSLVSISGAIWIVCSTCIGSYYGISTKVKYFLEYEGLYSLSFFTCKLFSYKFKGIKEKFLLRIIIYILIAYTVLANIFVIFNICYFKSILTILHIILGIAMLIYYILSIKYIKKHMDMFVIFTTLFISLSTFLILYNNDSTAFINSTKIIAMSIFTLGIYMLYSLINEIKISFVNRIERENLINKAYEDTLTNLNNRRSCEKKMQQINEDKENIYIIYSFDINGLKALNDNFGHKKGDELIIAFSNLLSNTFNEEKDFIGRMGGDEFLAIQTIAREDEPKSHLKIEKITKLTDELNTSDKYDFDISFAVGYSICDRLQNNKSWDCYNQADKTMYEHKREMKQSYLNVEISY